jgi:glycosyltransferase involved in cell wall biosynthesis
LNAIELIKDEANFVIVAPEDKENRASIDAKIMKPLRGKKHIQIFDKVDHKNLKKLYMDADVFVLPSYREGLPRVALEAMCSKLPLILTNVPGCRECIINNENGFLVEPKSTTSLVDAICKFTENPEIIERMGKKSYEIVKERFSNDIIFKKYAELL